MTAPTVVVRPWRHFFKPLDLAARVTVHPGSRAKSDGVEPVRPARAATAAELDSLHDVVDGPPRAAAVELLTTPALLRDHFRALDPDELPGTEGGEPSPRWRSFAAAAVDFLTHIRAPLPLPCRLVLDVRDSAQPPPLFATGFARSLLEGVAPGPRSVPATPALAAVVNVGDAAAALVVVSVALPAMAARLAADGLPPPADARGLVLAFARHVPACPLLRIALEPGDGALVPAPLVAFDMDAVGAADLVVTLAAVPGA